MIGQTVGSYRIVKKLGEGGMGQVYVGEHTVLGRRAAIKMLLPGLSSDAEAVQRFFNEARATAQIRHPGLIDVYDFGHHDSGSAFIVMELLEGEALIDRLEREGRLPVDLAAAIARQAATAVGAAHEKGIVHRDLKPENVYLTHDPDLPFGVRVKILDFGIAKLTGLEGSTVKTQASALLGTPLYMSPEQCHGAGFVDHRSDIYSLGCVLYEMVVGQPPFMADGMGALIAAHIYKDPEAPSRRNPAVPERLSTFILGALAKQPGDRYQTMAEFVARLDEVMPRQTVGAMPAVSPPGPPPAGPAPPRGRESTLIDSGPPASMPAGTAATVAVKPKAVVHPVGSWFYDALDLAQVGQRFGDHPGARPIRITSCVHNGAWKFALLLAQEPQGQAWWWYFGLDARAVANKLAEHGARLTDIDTVVDGGGLKFGTVMVQNQPPEPNHFYFGLDAAGVDQKVREHDGQIVDLDTYVEGGVRKFSCILTQATGEPWWWYHGLEAAALVARLNDNRARPVAIKSYLDGNQRRFACVMSLNTSENWLWFTGLDAAGVRAKLAENDAWLVDLDAWSDGAAIRYSAVMYRRR